MSAPATSVLVGLARTTLLVAAAAVIVQLLLWATRSSSPKARRVCWLLVLVQGWLWLRVPVTVPYYEPAGAMPSEPRLVGGEMGGWGRAQRAPSASEIGSDRRALAGRGPDRTLAPQHGPAARRTAQYVGPGASLGSTPATQRPGSQRAVAPSLVQWAWARANWPLLLAAVWLAGIVVSAGRWLVRYVLFVWGLPRGRTAEEAWVGQWQDLLAAEGVRRAIPLRITSTVGPVLCRLPSRWELLVPIDLWRSLTPQRRLAVLRHELAHLERGDAWKSLAVRLLALPHWFNPAAWWAVRRFDEAAEWACDRHAAGADHEQAVGYARTLVQLGAPSTPHPACGPAAQGRGLAVRVRRLLSPGTKEDSVMKRLFLIAMALGLVVVCLLRFDLVAREAEATPEGTVLLADQPIADEAEESGGGPGSAVEVESSGLSVGGGPKGGQPAGSPDRLASKLGRASAELIPDAEGRAPLRTLCYDGKGFEEWRREWKHELKPERRAEAVNAFAAFGANGYGKEAAEAILEVMRTLKMNASDARFSETSLREGRYTGTMLVKMSAVRAFLRGRPDYRIPPEDALKVLSRELKEGNRNGRLFAIFALRNMDREAVDAIPAVRAAFENDEDPTVRCCAYVALARLAVATGPEFGSELEMPPSALRELLKGAKLDALHELLTTLVPSSGWPYPLLHESPNKRRVLELRPGGEAIVEVLVEGLQSEDEATRRETISALTRLGIQARDVVPQLVPGLVRAFEKGPASDRRAICDALGQLARVPPQPQPNMYFQGKAEYDPAAIQGAETIPRLIQALDPRSLDDLSLMHEIYGRFGPAAEVVKAILQKAADDEDEQVRDTAKSLLEAISDQPPTVPSPVFRPR